jgi:glycosyltransferase involved in cell wall biosynthesis
MTRPTAIVVTSFPGDPTVQERRAAARSGRRPRKDFVEVADALGDVVVIDAHHMRHAACLPARLAVRIAGLPAGQVVEVFVRRRRYAHVIAWADRIGLALALLLKLRRDRQTDVVLISVLLTRGAKALLVRRLRVHTHLRAILGRSLQMRLLQESFGVDAGRLVPDVFGVDDRYFRPAPTAETPEIVVCAVGWEERDHTTLLAAAEGLDATVEVAVGSIALASDAQAVRRRLAELAGRELPANVLLSQRSPEELRDLYARSRCAVVSVHDVEFDAGVTALMEAMAMGLPVVATRSAGLAGLFTHEQEGLFVAPADPAALRGAIQRLLRDPEAAGRMGAAARRLVEDRHRLDDRVRRIADVVTGGRR